MSTTFAVFRIPVQTDVNGEIVSEYGLDDYIEVAHRISTIYWRPPFDIAEFALKDSVPVYPLDNQPQGIFTVGDIKKAIKKQLKGETIKTKEKKPKRVLHCAYLAWRSMWPKNDEFVDSKGRKHEMTRLFNCNEDKCERKFVELLKEFSEEQLWEALKAEIKWRKWRTEKTGENQLKFMNGPEPYLNQRKFESWLERSTSHETENPNKLVDPADLF